MNGLILLSSLFVLCYSDENCIRCICFSITTGWSFVDCANRTIKHIENCDEQCAIDLIYSYTNEILDKTEDIDCDGFIDCRDRYAALKWGLNAPSAVNRFNRAQTKRFDWCQHLNENKSKAPNMTFNGQVAYTPQNSCRLATF